MEKITEVNQANRLKKYGIHIKTKYQTHSGIRERNTDHSFNENVENGIRVEKLYYRNGVVLLKRKNFDSRIQYSYVSDPEDDKPFTCPNCGAVSESSVDGCPYCGTFWNMDYSHKDLGTKYTYDRTMKGSHYIKITFLVDFIFSIILSWVYIVVTGRTFNIFDISKVIVLAITLCAVMFYGFYYLDALVVLWPIQFYKDKLNQRQIEFWNRMEKRGIGKEKFYNNFNYEISRYFYHQWEDVIDYDILDYNSLQEFEQNGQLQVCVNATICLVSYDAAENKIRDKSAKYDINLVYRGVSSLKLNGGRNQIACKNCGSSIDVTTGKCPYCDTVYGSFQEWFLLKIS